MRTQWITFMGDFEDTESDLIFKGRNLEFQKGDTVEKKALIGKCVSNRVFDGGSIHAEITLSEVERSIAEVVVFHDLTTENMLTAGLGGDGYLFSIRYWNQTLNQWMPAFAKGGDRSNLKPNRPYSIDIEVQGSSLRMKIDGVDVASAFLPFQPLASQAGVFCISSAPITVSNFTVTSHHPTAFIVMPFNEKYNELYTDVIRPTCQAHGLRPQRADETYGPGVIIADIEAQIINAKVIIAEITPNPVNANVYYEVGYAHAIRKPTLLIADKHNTDKLPFDVSPFRVLFYENSIGGKKRVEEELGRHLRAIMPGGKPLADEPKLI